jgi:hypothetical protein
MSGDEKEQQLGKALQEYSAAKVALAHLDKKLKSVGSAYKQCGQVISEVTSGRLSVENGRLRVPYATDFDGVFLLDESGLVKLLNEKAEAEQAVRQLGQQLKDLGVSNVQ